MLGDVRSVRAGNLVPACRLESSAARIMQGPKSSCNDPASIHICGERSAVYPSLLAIRSRQERARSLTSRAIFSRPIPRPSGPSRLLHRGPPSQLFVDLQLAPKHVITRLAVSEEIAGNSGHYRSPRALSHFVCASTGGAILLCEHRSDVKWIIVAIAGRVGAAVLLTSEGEGER